jgi:hypothetical protein
VKQEMPKTRFTTAGRFALGASLLALAPLAAAAPAPSGPDVTSADLAAVSGAPGAPQTITLSGTSKLPNPAVTYQVVIPPKHGTLAPGDPNNPAVLIYTPAPGYVGPDHFWYRAVGSGGEQGDVALVNLTVSPTPGAPSPAILFADSFESGGTTLATKPQGRWSDDPTDDGASVVAIKGGRTGAFAARAQDKSAKATSAWLRDGFTPSPGVTATMSLRIDSMKLAKNQTRGLIRISNGREPGPRIEVGVTKVKGKLLWTIYSTDRAKKFNSENSKTTVPLNRWLDITVETSWNAKQPARLIVNGKTVLTTAAINEGGVLARQLDLGLLYTAKKTDNAAVSLDDVVLTNQGFVPTPS